VLAELIAATPSPAPPPSGGHSLYDWFSDIWLPAVVGASSVAVAVFAVLVARRSNRLSAASTKAAERSNALARRALAHDEARAREEDRQLGQAAREIFAGRAMDALDELARQIEQGDHAAAIRGHDQVTLLQMEAMSRGFKAAPIATAVRWITDVQQDHGKISRPDAFLKAKQSYHAGLSAWVTDPDSSRPTELVLGQILKQQLAGVERPDLTGGRPPSGGFLP
jgi:hypothetical protein